jgi:hypothetical protein
MEPSARYRCLLGRFPGRELPLFSASASAAELNIVMKSTADAEVAKMMTSSDDSETDSDEALSDRYHRISLL